MALLEADDGALKMHRQPLTGEAKWKDIEDLINRWARRDKKGAMLQEQWLKDGRELYVGNKHGIMENKSMADGRVSILLHPDLEAYIKAFYPEFLQTNDDLHEFMRRFPKFSVRQMV